MDQSPVVKSTFPKLTKVDRNFCFLGRIGYNVMFLNFMPGEKTSVN
jgi:hypothetical protein